MVFWHIQNESAIGAEVYRCWWYIEEEAVWKMTRVILSSIESHKRQMSMYILFVSRGTLLCMTGNRRSKSTHVLCCCLNLNIMRVQRRTKQTTYLDASQESCNFNLVCSMPWFASRLCKSVTAAGPAPCEEKQVCFGSSRGWLRWRTDKISTSPPPRSCDKKAFSKDAKLANVVRNFYLL